MMAYRAAVHETTKVSPYEMMFGRTINLPIDLVISIITIKMFTSVIQPLHIITRQSNMLSSKFMDLF
jgi:hypothetical protein